VSHCSKNPNDENVLDYEPANRFVICAGSFTPVYAGTETLQCGFCGAFYKVAYQSSICTICEIAEIGADYSNIIRS
jgi:coatomer protein complex subunit alpha (xenin)